MSSMSRLVAILGNTVQLTVFCVLVVKVFRSYDCDFFSFFLHLDGSSPSSFAQLPSFIKGGIRFRIPGYLIAGELCPRLGKRVAAYAVVCSW